jgi:hypothetical protein
MRFFVSVVLTLLLVLMLPSCDTLEVIGELPVQSLPDVIRAGNLEVRPVSIVKTGGLSTMNILYPEVGESDGLIDLEISRLLYDTIITEAKVNGDVSINLFEFYDGWVHTDLSYKVTFFSDDLLSIYYFGSLTGPGVGVRGFADIQGGVTIDLVSKDILGIEDFMSSEKLSVAIDNQDIYDVFSFYITETRVGLIGFYGEMRHYITVIEVELASYVSE